MYKEEISDAQPEEEADDAQGEQSITPHPETNIGTSFNKLISNKPTCFCQERTFSLSAELSWATQHPISQTFLKHNLKHNTDIWHRVVFVSSEFQTFPLFISILIQQVPCIAFCLSRPFRQLLAGSLLCPCY